MKVLIIGDKPSAKNLDPNIPFIGTASYKVLQEWLITLKLVNLETLIIRNAHLSDNSVDNETVKILKYADKIIVLGANAEKTMRKFTEQDLFRLNHPSPKNRANNDKKKLEKQLQDCYDWLWQTKETSKCPACVKACGNEWCKYSNGER